MSKDTSKEAVKKLTAYVGFAKKSGRITVGCVLTVDGIRNGGRKTPLVAVCASDASKNTKSRIENSCKYYEVPLVNAPVTCEQLGNIVGKGTSVSVVGITDMQLSNAILNYFNQE